MPTATRGPPAGRRTRTPTLTSGPPRSTVRLREAAACVNERLPSGPQSGITPERGMATRLGRNSLRSSAACRCVQRRWLWHGGRRSRSRPRGRFGCRIPCSTRCGFSSWSSLIGFIGAVDCVEEHRLRRSNAEFGVWMRRWAGRGRRSDGVDDAVVPTPSCSRLHMPSTVPCPSYTGCPPMIHNRAPTDPDSRCPQVYPHLWSHRCTSETCERDRAGSERRRSTPVDSVVDKRLEQSPGSTVERPPQTCDLRRNSVRGCQ